MLIIKDKYLACYSCLRNDKRKFSLKNFDSIKLILNKNNIRNPEKSINFYQKFYESYTPSKAKIEVSTETLFFNRSFFFQKKLLLYSKIVKACIGRGLLFKILRTFIGKSILNGLKYSFFNFFKDEEYEHKLNTFYKKGRFKLNTYCLI